MKCFTITQPALENAVVNVKNITSCIAGIAKKAILFFFIVCFQLTYIFASESNVNRLAFEDAGCEPDVAATFNGCASCVDVSSTKDLSNVVLLLCDGTEYKHDNLSVGQTGTFCSPDGQNILAVWIKSGCNSSSDGPGYGEFVDGPCEAGSCGSSSATTPTTPTTPPPSSTPAVTNLECPNGFIALDGDFHSTSNSGAVTGLFPFAGTDATFEYELIGANPGQHPKWNYGVGSENNSDLAPDGDYIKVQVRNSGFPDGDRAKYRLVFSNEVHNLEFKWGGNDHSDRISVVAMNGSTPVDVTLENISIPSNELTWIGDNGLISDSNAGNAPDNAVKVSFSEPVTEFTIEAAKHNNSHNNVTMQLYELRYCVPQNQTFAKNDLVKTALNTTVVGQVLTNDIDPEGDAQSVTLLTTPPAHKGSVTLSSNGQFAFTPAPDFHGATKFTYEVCDDASNVACDEAKVTVVVSPAANSSNANLIALDDDKMFSRQGVNGQILGNDHDWNGSTLTVSTIMTDTDGDGIVDTPANVGTTHIVGGITKDGQSVSHAGELTVQADGNFSFIPTSTFDGNVVAKYTTQNTFGETAEANVTLSGIGTSGNCTSAADDVKICDKNITATGNLLHNDCDLQQDAQTVDAFSYDTNGDGHADATASLDTPTALSGIDAAGNVVAHAGDITISANGDYTFIPATDFVGNLYLPYEISDSQGAKSAATLTINILDAVCDLGDADIAYGMAAHRGYTDTNNDETPDGTNDIWLGNKISPETQMVAASEDQHDDGMLAFSPTATAHQYDMELLARTNTTQTVYYGVWVDYDDDKNYDDFLTGSQVVDGTASIHLTIDVPQTIDAETTPLNIRTRVDDQPFVQTDYEGLRTNGEVEDHRLSFQAMPVEMMYFQAKANDCESVSLVWGTASEENNSHFEVERSMDGRNFELIGTVDGNGNSTEAIDYEFVDNNMPNGLAYYRLKQVDYDGAFEYSDVVSVKSECGKAAQMSVFPNPTLGASEITIDLDMPTASDVVVKVFTTAGQQVTESHFNTEAGENQFNLSLDTAPQGMLFIIIQDENATKLGTVRLMNQ